MVGNQCEQRAQGVFAVVQLSWDGLHSSMLLGHRQQPGGTRQSHLTLVLRVKEKKDTKIDWDFFLKHYLRFGCPSITAYPVGSFPAPSKLRETSKSRWKVKLHGCSKTELTLMIAVMSKTKNRIQGIGISSHWMKLNPPDSSPSTVNQELVPVWTVTDDSCENPHSHVLHTAWANHRLLHICMPQTCI